MHQAVADRTSLDFLADKMLLLAALLSIRMFQDLSAEAAYRLWKTSSEILCAAEATKRWHGLKPEPGVPVKVCR